VEFKQFVIFSQKFYKVLAFSKADLKSMEGSNNLFFLLSFGVGSLFISGVGQPAASAEAERLVLSFRNP